MQNDSKGVIYILKNPSFPDYIKIGYADNIENRLKQLNNSECTPFAFRIYATYEVDSRLSDLKIHSIIDKLNPDLRSIDNFNGKKRVREFYAMSAEDAYSIFEAIAEIHNCTDKLKKWSPNSIEIKAEEVAEQVQLEKKARHSNWTFDDWQIPNGSELEYVKDTAVKCVVVNRRKVEYNGEILYMTQLAREITGKKQIVHGPGWVAQNFKYNDELIEDIEKRLHNNK
ncbi:MAG: GIY-YIG nuclease family protein [Clostridia bacterium]|nr:GIY-YIG nuclease family protein [Clostridia bacterium]